MIKTSDCQTSKRLIVLKNRLVCDGYVMRIHGRYYKRQHIIRRKQKAKLVKYD